MYASDIIQIRYSKIYNEKVIDNIKIASISDIHISDKVTLKDLERIIRIIYLEETKYICLLGDLIDSPSVIKNNKDKCLIFLKELSKIAPVYMVIGNHDYINYYKGKMYEEEYNKDFFYEIEKIINLNILDNKVKYLKEITFMGYTEKYNVFHNRNINSFYTDFSKKEELYNINTNTPNVALIHSPEPLKYLNRSLEKSVSRRPAYLFRR